MRLTKMQKEICKSWGYTDEDIEQIERAAEKTTYTHDGKRISRKKAIELLGERDFLSGLTRSAFHWSAGRGSDGNYVSFDSFRFFKEAEA